MSKISIGGILKLQNLTLIKIMGLISKPGHGGKLLTVLGDANINMHFIAESEDISSRANLTICINPDKEILALDLIQKEKDTIGISDIVSVPNITALTVYGPHFREKPAICGSMCSALGSEDINILGISTSISSICCLIDDNDFSNAYNALLNVFALP